MAPPEINWLQEGLRIGGTGIIALLGAWVGFGLANQGRRHDVIIKESFISTKKFVGMLIGIKNTIDTLNILLASNQVRRVRAKASISSKVIELLRINNQKIQNYSDELSATAGDIILLSDKSREDHIVISVRLFHLMADLDRLIEMTIRDKEEDSEWDALRKGTLGAMAGLKAYMSLTIDRAYSELNLPGLRPYYDKDYDQITVDTILNVIEESEKAV